MASRAMSMIVGASCFHSHDGLNGVLGNSGDSILVLVADTDNDGNSTTFNLWLDSQFR